MIDEAFNYAEVDAEWLVHALQKLKNIHGQMQFSGGVFYDLGSGVGRTAQRRRALPPYSASAASSTSRP